MHFDALSKIILAYTVTKAAGKAQVSMASELLDGNVADQDVMDVTSIAYTGKMNGSTIRYRMS